MPTSHVHRSFTGTNRSTKTDSLQTTIADIRLARQIVAMVVRAPVLLLLTITLSACVSLKREVPAKDQRVPIVIDQGSNVCVSVHVDQRIWPRPIDADLYRALSGSLMGDLRRMYLAKGGTYAVPNSRPAERFIGNEDGATPSCQDHEVDVMIELQYRPRADGEPFVLDYSVSRGSAQREGSIDVNVAEEIRAGRIRGYDQRRTDAIIIEEDLERRASSLFELLQMRE